MNPSELLADYQRLENRIKLLEVAAMADDAQDELISLSANYICVDICGRLEQNLKSVFSSFSGRKSGQVLDRSIAKLLSAYQNPKSTKLLELIDLFDKDLSSWLKESWKENAEHEIAKKHIDNLVADRIILAHSKKISHIISITKLKNYFSAYKSIISFLAYYFLDVRPFEVNAYIESRNKQGCKATF